MEGSAWPDMLASGAGGFQWTALLPASVTLLGVAVGLWVNNRSARHRQFAEQLALALSLFQGSQQRSAGIASLKTLRHFKRLWLRHEREIIELLYAQALYLLRHGSNRWQEHEIANIEAILEWLLPASGPTRLLTRSQAERLVPAMQGYVAAEKLGSWKASKDPSEEGVGALSGALRDTYVPRAEQIVRVT